MAVELSKYSGRGNATITASNINEVYTGRVNKTTTFKGFTSNGASATIKVIEAACGIYGEVNTDISISNDDTSFTISGVSNAYVITVGYSGTIADLKHDALIVNGEPQNLENLYYVITDDPGKNGLYEYSITFHCSKNNSIAVRTANIHMGFQGSYQEGDDESIGKTINVTQAAGSAYVYWSTTSGEETTAGTATMTQAGTAIYTYIMSNTSWAIILNK